MAPKKRITVAPAQELFSDVTSFMMHVVVYDAIAPLRKLSNATFTKHMMTDLYTDACYSILT